jgi:hypothetical protein
MAKLKLFGHNKDLIITVGLFSVFSVHSQTVEFKFDPSISTVFALTKENNRVDTMCAFELIITTGESPAYCQNDSLYMICSRFPSGFSMQYSFYIFSKRGKCEILERYFYREENHMIWRRSNIYSKDNRIYIDFNDCASSISILGFDPYTMTIKDVRSQILKSKRKIR